MNREGWKGRILQVAEERITDLVNRILATNYPNPGRGRGKILRALASMDIPSREETDALKEQVGRLKKRIEDLSARLEAREEAPGGNG